jgi:type III secretion protein L
MTRFVKAGGARVVAAPSVDAHREAADIRGRAERAGFDAGLARTTELACRWQDMLGRSQNELRLLAVRIAEKIIGAELTLRPEIVDEICRRAVAEAGERHQTIVRVHPDDLALIDQALRTRVTFVSDASVSRGGCLVKTEAGVVDAQLDTQLRAIERALTEPT